MAELDEEKVKFEIDGHPLDGYIPSPPDDRDYTLETVCALDDEELPEEYITDKEVPVLNQGANSDCVAHAIAVAIAHGQYKAEGKFNDFSRGYSYGNRKLTDAQGEGMIVRQALKNCNHDGDCLNIVFPYRGTYPKMKAKIAEKPKEYAREAAKSKIVNYCRLYSEREIKKAIMRQGAVVIGTTLFEGFGTHVKVPTKDSKKTGGHAMCCVGWNKEGWIIQNSWGSLWGDHGYCYMPYEYPADEWWGITVSTTIPQPEKDSFLKRLINFFKYIIINLRNFFHKEKK